MSRRQGRKMPGGAGSSARRREESKGAMGGLWLGGSKDWKVEAVGGSNREELESDGWLVAEIEEKGIPRRILWSCGGDDGWMGQEA